MAVQKARIAGRVVLVSSALFFAWLLMVWPPPIWWRDHEPRCTAMMRLRDNCAMSRRTNARPSRHATTHLLERMVIIAEDSRFKTHHGVDFVELRDAWVAGGHRGASTITQQLAKNLYLSPSRSLLRKLKEAVTAIRLELALSKDRIMEMYLDVAEFGPGIWGVNAASQAYFGVTPDQLTDAQAAALVATLPHIQSGVSAGAYARAPRSDSRALLRREDPSPARLGGLDPRDRTDRASRTPGDSHRFVGACRFAGGFAAGLANPQAVVASRGPCRTRDRSSPRARWLRRAPEP